MKILAMDSSSKSASVAIVEDEKLIAENFINAGLTHSQTIMQMASDLLKVSGEDIDNIDAFAITNGPGSFTGLRIGAAAIKGMAFAGNKSCKEVSTLEALAYNLLGFNGYVLPLLDARCNQFYFSFFKTDGEKILRIAEDSAGNSDDIFNVIGEIKKPIYLVGDGANLFFKMNEERLKDYNIIIPADRIRFVNAYCVALAAKDKESKSADELRIEYLRLPQAERELKKKENK
jgi:tRNA threonylcarbamoyladenosine biosynthesis protein TsaB